MPPLPTRATIRFQILLWKIPENKEHSSTPLIPFAEKKKREGHRLPPSSLDQVSREKEGEGGGLVEQIGTNDRRKAVKASLYIRVEAVEPR